MADRLFEEGISAGLICPGVQLQATQVVQVAMVPTLHRRAVASERMGLPPADLVLVDECHHVPAASYQAILKAYAGAVILGLTATPARTDSRGLGGVFEIMIEAETVRGLVRRHVLAPLSRVYAPVTLDVTKGVGTTAGDFNKAQLGKRMNDPKLVGDVVADWLRRGQGRQTIVFCVDRAHAAFTCEQFQLAGVMAAYVDGATPADERKRILTGLKSGRIQVVCNCMVLTEGFDAPTVSCIVLARPTKSFPLFLQMLGRGMRASSATGKIDWILIDHSGSIYRHGFPDEPVKWALKPDKKAERPLQAAREQGHAKSLVTCPECGAVRLQGEGCPACGWRPRQRGEGVETVEGELSLVTRKRKSAKVEPSAEDRMRFYQELLGYARERRTDTGLSRHKDGWAAYSYQEKHGRMPPYEWQRNPLPPSDATRSWIRSRQIAYAKGRQKARAA